MKTEEKIDKYLGKMNELDMNIDNPNDNNEMKDFVKGIKYWLDTVMQAHNRGNTKLIKSTLQNIKKQIDKMLKSI